MIPTPATWPAEVRFVAEISQDSMGQCPLFDRWKDEINLNTSEWEQLHTEYREIPLKLSLLRKSKRENELSEDEFWIKHEALKQREAELYKQIYGREK